MYRLETFRIDRQCPCYQIRQVAALCSVARGELWFAWHHLLGIVAARCYMQARPMSVCLSVCLCLSRSSILSKRINISTKKFSPSSSHTILVFPYQTGWQYSDGDPSNGGVECKRKNHDFRPISRFISEITQYRASYYERRIGNRTQAFEWYQFEWSWVTSNPDFKVTLSFNDEYLGNGTRYRTSYNKVLIRTNVRLLKNVIQNDLEWPRVS